MQHVILLNSSQMDGKVTSWSDHWPDAHWNRFRGNSGRRAGTLDVQLTEIYEDNMLPWVLNHNVYIF